jgi:membrane dipeptidase
MIVDLHAHYAMHLVPQGAGTPIDMLSTAKGRERLRDRLRARLIGLASRFANYRSFESGPRVTIPKLQEGHVGVALSVLYSFFDELDLDAPYGAPPEAGYLPRLIAQLEMVETDIRERHPAQAAVVRDPVALERELDNGRVALIHCVEGGFHLGETPEAVDRAVAALARRGVAYIVLSHLLWRGVATNSPALPFLPDWLYRLLFPQPKLGLSELGRAAVKAMVREGVVIDLSHMSRRALADTFELLDALDPDRRVPVIVSHGAFRFGRQEYGVDEETIGRIAARNGVVGLIFAQHQLNDGLRRTPTQSFEDSFEVICRHLDRIAQITGSHEYAAIGSDLDGFIKPTMAGLESMTDMARLEAALRDRYDADDCERICSGNALRVLRAGWGAERRAADDRPFPAVIGGGPE